MYSGFCLALLLFLVSWFILQNTMPCDSLDTQRTAMDCFQLRNWQRMPYYFFSICYHLKEDFLAHHHTPIISERKKQGGFDAAFFLSTTSFRVISTELPWYRSEARHQFFCQKQSSSNRFLHSCRICPNPFPRPCSRAAFSNLSDTGLMLISSQTILGQSSLPG